MLTPDSPQTLPAQDLVAVVNALAEILRVGGYNTPFVATC